MLNKCFSLAVALLFSVVAGKAQSSCTLRLKAVVLSTTGLEPIAQVSVLDLIQNKTYTSDKKGQLTMVKPCSSRLHIEVSALGFETIRHAFTLKKDSMLSIQLSPEARQISAVDVVGRRSVSVSSSQHKLSAQALAESKGKLLADALGEIAGVTSISMGHSIVKPVINGLHSNRILMLNNGVRQEGQQWGVEHAPEIDPFVADRLEVIKGAQAVQYGADALAGVVLVSANKIDTRQPIGGSIDLIARSNGRAGIVNAQLEGGIAKLPNLGWRIQSSGKKSGNIKTADYYLGNTGVQELNFSSTLQYKLGSNELEAYYSHFGTELGIFDGAHIGTVEDLHARIAYGRPFETYAFSYAIEAPRQLVDHDLLKLSWKKQLTSNKSLDLQYSYQRNHRREYDKRRVVSDNTAMADMILSTQSLAASLRSGNNMLGMQMNMQINNNQAGTGTTPIIPNFDSYNLGLFASKQLAIKRVQAELGIRYDYKYLDAAGYRYDYANPLPNGVVNQYLMHDSRQFHNLSGTVGIQYPISKLINWKSNLGLAWRAPSANELYSDGVHHGSGTYEVGDKSLKSEKGLKWTNALALQTGGFSATLDLYGQIIYDYIYAQPNPDSLRQTIRGTFPLFAYAQHNALFYGADLMLMYSFNESLSYSLGASLLRAKNISQDSYLPYIPADRFKQSIHWNLPTGKSSTSYLKFSHRFVAQQTRYEIGSDYSEPPAAYHLLDLIASSSFSIGQKNDLILSAAVDNIFNHAYKEYMDRFRYFAHQMGRNISIKISYQF